MKSLTQPLLIDDNPFDGPVMVTGAAGCIGAWVLAILKRSGISCIAADIAIDSRRLELIVGPDEAADYVWQGLDVTDGAAVSNFVKDNAIDAIIHLAGLQVPFCAADPARGARVNVEGTVNILQAARENSVSRLAYASSVAAVCFPPGPGFKETLYGAYKVANEQTALVYWQDWQVPSVGLRPNVVYGLGRDQGMSSLTTAAIHAAACHETFEIPFTGPYSWLHAGEAASAFIAAVSRVGENAAVYDLNGPCVTVEDGINILKNLAPNVRISSAGAPFPFPPDLDETKTHANLPDYKRISVEDGIASTYRAFCQLAAEDRLPALPV